jgi:hypothetical protein
VNVFQTKRVEVTTVSQLLKIAFLFLPAIVSMMNCVSASEEDSSGKVTTKRDDDKVEVAFDQEKAVISVHSPMGISQAIIERSDNKWPISVILRLCLKGLENFKVTNGNVTAEAALSSQDGKVRIWKGNKEGEPLDVKHPYWMKIRMVGNDGKPVLMIPLKDGYFEMQLPKALFEDHPNSITLNWIDFCR